MKRYQHHRAVNVFGAIAAVAATLLTLALTVVLPAAPPAIDGATVTMRAHAPIEVAIVPGRVEVIGIRSERAAADPVQAGGGQS